MNRRNQQDAAVLIPEVKTGDGIEIILEQRALSLLHQPGECGGEAYDTKNLSGNKSRGVPAGA